MVLPVVLDEDKSLSKAFPHSSIPHTIVIDKNGIIKSITYSSEITSDVIKKLIVDNSIKVKEKQEGVFFDPSRPLGGGDNILFQVTLTPYIEGAVSMIGSGGEAYLDRRILCTNVTLMSLYTFAFNFLPTRAKLQVQTKERFSYDKQNLHCFDLIVPDELKGSKLEIMKQQLKILFNYDAVVESRIEKVKALSVIDEDIFLKSRSLKEQDDLVQYGRTGLLMQAGKPQAIADFLESKFRIPVVCDINRTELFTLELNWSTQNPEAIHDELKKIGLALKDDEREIEVLIIRDR